MKQRLSPRKSSKAILDSALKHRSKYQQTIRRPRTAPAQSVKILIIYEGIAGLSCANEAWGKIAAHFDGEVLIETCAWNMALLRGEHLREQAALQAAESDIIVISPGMSGELPECVRNWIESWRPIERRQADVVPPSMKDGAQSMFRDCLRQMPRPDNLDVFWKPKQSPAVMIDTEADRTFICQEE